MKRLWQDKLSQPDIIPVRYALVEDIVVTPLSAISRE
jgi:hypothetical protein